RQRRPRVRAAVGAALRRRSRPAVGRGVMLCVYAVRPASGRVRGTGAMGERLVEIAAGPIAAVAGRVPRAPRASERVLRAYDRVVRTVADQSSAILPVRFGTIVGDEEELRRVLRERQPLLRRTLRHVRGRLQMTIRIVTEPNARSPKSNAPRANS